MACRGVFFAITDEDAARLLAAKSDEEVLDLVQEEIEERWDEGWLQETDKSWDAMHRSLSDGTLECSRDTPLEKCVLGGRQLYEGDDYTISFVSPSEVKEVAAAIGELDKAWMRLKYFQIDPCDYDVALTEEDFEYTWEWFQGVQAFYRKAAAHNRPVIFTVDH
jgi:hypothetical protein